MTGHNNNHGSQKNGWGHIHKWLEFVKFSHTVFALPFALIAMFVAARGVPSLWVFCWILVAMVGARTTAMSANRIFDREIDATNPRTANRALVIGAIQLWEAWTLLVVSAVIFVLSAGMLNRLALWLSPIVLVVMYGYPFTKRWCSGTHFVLGIALAIAPAGAWIAVRGQLDGQPIWLSAAVLCWVAGFDIIYALQDETVDRIQGLHSAVVRFGARGALVLSRWLHCLTVVFLTGFGWAAALGVWYGVGVALVALALVYEHWLVSPTDRSKVNTAFFTVNGWVGIVLLACTLMAVLW